MRRILQYDFNPAMHGDVSEFAGMHCVVRSGKMSLTPIQADRSLATSADVEMKSPKPGGRLKRLLDASTVATVQFWGGKNTGGSL